MPDQVEEFLKRVARMRAEAEAQARNRAPQRPAAPPQPLAPAKPPVDYSPPVQAEVVDAELTEVGDSVSRHVTEHLRGSAEIAEHTRHLGEEVDQADDKLAAHLHQVFDHQLGRLRSSVTDEAAASASSTKRTGFTAGAIASMLLSPDNIRNAMVLGEILRRPEELE